MVTPSGRTKYRVWISNCGQVDGDGKGTTEDEGREGSAEEEPTETEDED